MFLGGKKSWTQRLAKWVMLGSLGCPSVMWGQTLPSVPPPAAPMGLELQPTSYPGIVPPPPANNYPATPVLPPAPVTPGVPAPGQPMRAINHSLPPLPQPTAPKLRKHTEGAVTVPDISGMPGAPVGHGGAIQHPGMPPMMNGGPLTNGGICPPMNGEACAPGQAAPGDVPMRRPVLPPAMPAMYPPAPMIPPTDAPYPPERWYASGEALFWTVNRATLRTLVINEDTQFFLANTRDLTYGYETGTRVALGVHVSDHSSIEGVYFGLYDSSANYAVVGNNDISLTGMIGFTTFDYFRADSMLLQMTTNIHNGEVNYVCQTEVTGLEWLAGFRYMNFREKFSIHSTDSNSGDSDYRVKVDNNLFGGQIGTRFRLESGFLGLELTGKAGVFGNGITLDSFLGDFNNTQVLRDFRVERDNVAFIGEASLTGLFMITENVYLRSGYTVMWIEGIGRASDQLDFNDTPTAGMEIRKNGGAFVHGAHAGLEIRW